MTELPLKPIHSRAILALLPLLNTPEERESFLIMAFGLNHPLLRQIDFSHSAATFNINLLQELADYGWDESGEHALWMLLKAVRDRVGVDKQKRIDDLQNIFTPAPVPEEPEQPKPAVPVRRATTATVNIVNAPANARFFVGDDVYDQSPLVLPFQRGEAEKQIVLCVTCESYFDDEYELTLRRGDVVDLPVSPKPRPAVTPSRGIEMMSRELPEPTEENAAPGNETEIQAVDIRPKTARRPRRAKTPKETVNPIDGAAMIWIPPGIFTMGSNAGDPDARPAHQVMLDGYYIYKTPVTAQQYYNFCIATRRTPMELPADTNIPATNVSWGDAQEYAAWAGVLLPTEAHWEKAARGTDERLFPWGGEWDIERCAHSALLTKETPMPCGSFPKGASAYGVLDMAGNVWEWCEDGYEWDFYAKSPADHPLNDIDHVWMRRVTRGGCFRNNEAAMFHTFKRDWQFRQTGFDIVGFRCIRLAE